MRELYPARVKGILFSHTCDITMAVFKSGRCGGHRRGGIYDYVYRELGRLVDRQARAGGRESLTVEADV